MIRHNGFWHLLTLFTFILATVIIFGFIIFSVWPYKIATIKVPIQILNTNHQIRIGEPIRMKVILDKYVDIKPQVDTFITCDDHNTVTQDGKGASRPVGHYEYINETYILPKSINVGTTCKFTFKNTYQVNPFRTITKVWDSEEFKVIN